MHGPGGRGLIKVVEDADRGVLVGATAMGPAGGEILGFLAVAVHAEVPTATLRIDDLRLPDLPPRDREPPSTTWSDLVGDVSQQAERLGRAADNSDWLDRGIRIGLVAYGIVHLMIGWLALQLAFGHRSGQTSNHGALHQLAHSRSAAC